MPDKPQRKHRTIESSRACTSLSLLGCRTDAVLTSYASAQWGPSTSFNSIPRRYRRIHRGFCFRALGHEQRSGLPPHPREIRTLQTALRRGQTASPTCGGRLMLRLDQSHQAVERECVLNDHINLYGFWNETAFLPKSGRSRHGSERSRRGLRKSGPLSTGVRSEAVGGGTQIVWAQASMFTSTFSNRTAPDIPFATYDDPIVQSGDRPSGGSSLKQNATSLSD